MTKVKCTKKSYWTIKLAWNDCLWLFTQYGWYNTPYKCRYCKRYHTTQSKADPIPSRQFIEGFNKWFGREVLKVDEKIK